MKTLDEIRLMGNCKNCHSEIMILPKSRKFCSRRCKEIFRMESVKKPIVPVLNLENETWKDVCGYEGLYMVSSLSRIKSVDRVIKSGVKERKISGTLLKPQINNKGYLIVSLNKLGFRKTCTVHRIFAISFIPKIKGKDIINHKDGNRLNNSLGNLEWCTIKENVHHGVLGKRTKGKKVIDKESGMIFDSVTIAAIHLNLSRDALSKMINGKQKNITSLSLYHTTPSSTNTTN